MKSYLVRRAAGGPGTYITTDKTQVAGLEFDGPKRYRCKPLRQIFFSLDYRYNYMIPQKAPDTPIVAVNGRHPVLNRSGDVIGPFHPNPSLLSQSHPRLQAQNIERDVFRCEDLCTALPHDM